MESRKDDKQAIFLPDEMVVYAGRFFSHGTRARARQVCKQWAECIPPVLHLYILGSPIFITEYDIKKPDLADSLARISISNEIIQKSFADIPQNGFMIFPTFQAAHLYAHTFYAGRPDPNFNEGIHGMGYRTQTFLGWRSGKLYHPAIFEVAYSAKGGLNIEWHPHSILNLEGMKTMQISAIRGINCKNNI